MLQTEELEPRYDRRLSDLITAAFFEACKAGSLDAAAHLVAALEAQVRRSVRLRNIDEREDGDDMAAVQARLRREVTRLHEVDAGSIAASRNER